MAELGQCQMLLCLTAEQESALSQQQLQMHDLKLVKAKVASSPELSYAQSMLQAVKKESHNAKTR